VELGDLLLHLAFQVVLAEELGRFGPEDLTRQVEDKMWRRHPHLFAISRQHGGTAEAAEGATPVAPLTPEDVKANWERLKLRERRDEARPSVLDGLPPTMPALVMAFRLQERAAGVGFDWPDASGPAAKVREELEEVEAEIVNGEAGRAERLDHEIGDLLFSVVNLARKVGIHPGPALERANRRFTARFRYVERLAEERGTDLAGAGLAALDLLWEEAKEAG
jgi:MazG family protein